MRNWVDMKENTTTDNADIDLIGFTILLARIRRILYELDVCKSPSRCTYECPASSEGAKWLQRFIKAPPPRRWEI